MSDEHDDLTGSPSGSPHGRDAASKSSPQTYTITVLPSSGNDRKVVRAENVTDAVNQIMRNIHGEPWSDGPNPWVLTLHIARGDEGTLDLEDARRRMHDDERLQEYYVHKQRCEVASKPAEPALSGEPEANSDA